MFSVGIDLVEIARIERSMKHPRFCARLFGEEEIRRLSPRGFPARSVAAGFCAKEAFAKAVGTGFGPIRPREIELLRAPSGRPELRLSGRAAAFAGGRTFSVSVTHTAGYAAAAVVGEADGGKRGPLPGFTEEGGSRLRSILRPRAAESNKGDYGRLLSVCGSEGMAGAAAMSALAALRCGAGIVEAALPRAIYPVVSLLAPEAVFTLLGLSGDGRLTDAARAALLAALSRADACLLGCGLGRGPAARELVPLVLREIRAPLVLDADGINLAAGNIDILKTARAPLILTPHPGEMARLLHSTVKEVQENREETARSFAREHGAVLVLKGAGTLVASPDGRLYRNRTGNPGMARGGSGDVLAGMIASFAAQGIEPFSAACGAVYLHGLAGDRCAARLSQSAMLPRDLIGALPELFLELGR